MGRTPHGVRGLKCCVCNIGVVVRLCFGVSCGICAGAIVLTSRLSVAPGRHVVAVVSVVSAVAVPGRGRHVLAVAVVRRRPGVPGCGVPGCRRSRLYVAYGRVAVVWLRHADEC